MVETNTKVVLPGDRMKARMARVRRTVKAEGVRVIPNAGEGYTEDDMRRLLKHPSAGGFRSEGSIEWPDDTFTRRRLADGSIKLAEEHKGDDKQRHARGHQSDAA